MSRFSVPFPFLVAVLFPQSAAAASGPFFSLNNTDFVVSISFLLFVALLVWLRVPGRVAGLLDRRADGIRSDLDEARKLREEAKALLDASEKKKREIDEQTETIVRRAHEEAETAAEQARRDLHAAVERRIQAAEDRIASAEADAIREVQDAAANVAVAVAADVISSGMPDRDADELIEEAIENAARRLEAGTPTA